MSLRQKPYHLFLIAAIILVVVSLFHQQTIDVNLHDTYFVISSTVLFIGIAALLLLLWALYKIGHKVLLSNKLTWFHVGLTLLTLILFFSVSALNNLFYVQQVFIVIIIASFFIGQVFFLINLIIGLIRKLRQGRLDASL